MTTVVASPPPDGAVPDGAVPEGQVDSRRRSTAVRWLQNAWPVAVVAVAGGLWWVSLPGIDPEQINDYGLVSALPAGFFAALVLLTASFCVCIARPRPPVSADAQPRAVSLTGRSQTQQPSLSCERRCPATGRLAHRTPVASLAPGQQILLALHTVALVVILQGTLPLVYEAPRYAYTYKHLGVVEYIASHGGVDTSIDIYHNWPGFFVLAAGVVSATGLEGSVGWVAWAQLVNDLLYLAALVVVFRSLTTDRRVVWLGIWFFFTANWIGQDYFSPQGFAYLLYLLVIAVCLRRLRGQPLGPGPQWLRPRPLVDAYRELVNRSLATRPPPTSPGSPTSTRERATGVLVVVGLFAVIVVSHQLTPFAVVSGVTLLTVFGWVRPRYLPVVMVAVLAAWLVRTYPFLSQELGQGESAGSPVSNAASSLAGLDGVSAARVVVLLSSRVLTGAVWLLAAVGVVRRVRHGHWDLAPVLLAAAPAVLLLNAYGGEVLMRISFLSLPWVAFLAAAAFFPHAGTRGSVGLVVATGAASLVLLGTLLFAYYGHERVNYIRVGEVEAAQWFYDNTEPGSLLMLAAPNFPARLDDDYHEHPGFDYDVSVLHYPQFLNRPLGPRAADEIAAEMAGWGTADAYLMFSESQVAYAEMERLTPVGALDDLEAAVAGSDRFRVLFTNADATLYRLLPTSAAAGS